LFYFIEDSDDEVVASKLLATVVVKRHISIYNAITELRVFLD